ncbi:RNA 2',3'-cyclic phosphodiesterase [Ectobacillus ponti]|uniref:RNA 2',3'-cyclic phosphodiesterase n=1 Tax=Ectobacillus ponti TaxID=2961894 RepID=A0AA41X216_9BACI|nr:RNA 2',3'-cyclic phosphodiesterase [Ectobacillus ponti]MCP8967499.1 RNA 2',3'-cyclic phosphodiesterase [Ectobacillus ponti]
MNTHYFLAIELPASIKDIVREWREQHPLPFQTWVHRDDYHITLVFLGNTETSVLEKLKQRMDERLPAHRSFDLQLRGLGVFGNPAHPRILWTGVTEPQPLFDLQRETADLCRELGFAVETRPYRPHITIARKWGGPPLAAGVKQWETEVLQQASFTACRVVLYQTHLARKPKYEVLHTVHLPEE